MDAKARGATARMRRWLSAAAPVLIYGAVIVFLSSQSELPKGPKIWDKAAHFLEYTVLGVLLTRAVRLITGSTAARSAVIAVLLATAFAFTDEVHQYFVPGRDADPLDVVADFLGSVVGGAIYVAWLRVHGRWRRGVQTTGG